MENTIEAHKEDNAARILKVLAERVRQTEKFGERKQLNPFVWAAVLGEEKGEVDRAILEQDFENLKTELIEVAAVALAFHKDLEDNGTKYRNLWGE